MNTKNRILEQLERQRGESISGERLAGLLGVSRNAVWKAVKDLQKDGYCITAVTNRGYCLSPDNDILSVPGIKPYLSENTLPYADRIRIHACLDSTNKTAKELAVAGAPHGTVVLAHCQTRGRGRYSRTFFSPPGGLYLSVVLRPQVLRFQTPTAVTAFAAVSVCEAISAVTHRAPEIKWVNDIFLDGKKVCGILTEAMTDFESGSLDWIVLGIGLNVSAAPESFPPELQSVATSLYPCGSVPGVRNRLAAEILNRLLGPDTPPEEADIFRRYRARLMVLGKEITVIQNQQTFQATALDIDAAGHLIVSAESGQMLTLSSGEIRLPHTSLSGSAREIVKIKTEENADTPATL